MRAGGPLPLFITMNIIMIMNKIHKFYIHSNNRYSAYNFVKSTETYPFIESVKDNLSSSLCKIVHRNSVV